MHPENPSPLEVDISPDLISARAIGRQALRDIFAKYPEIKANDDLRIAIDDTLFDVAEIMAGMPEAERKPFTESQLAEYVEGMQTSWSQQRSMPAASWKTLSQGHQPPRDLA